MAQEIGCDAHKPVKTAKQEVQISLLARPQPPVQKMVDAVADPAHSDQVRACDYLQTPRQLTGGLYFRSGLTDHAAMTLTVDLNQPSEGP